MAKIYGLFGSMQGKVADVVMAVRNGEQIVRKYQPIVSNPKSANQVASRAKLKLVSQLSAAMRNVIAIPRDGSVSGRNIFTKVNYPLASYASNTASIQLPLVQLTNSQVSMPALAVGRDGNQFSVQLAAPLLNVDRVVYMVFWKDGDNLLELSSTIATNAGAGHNYLTQIAARPEECIVYAYGVKDLTNAATVAFGNMETPTAESVAKLLVTSSLSVNDVAVTRTAGVIVPAAA